MDKFLANSLYDVHVRAGRNSDKTLGVDSLSPSFIKDCFEELVRLGMPREPQKSGAEVKRACATAMS